MSQKTDKINNNFMFTLLHKHRNCSLVQIENMLENLHQNQNQLNIIILKCRIKNMHIILIHDII